MPYINIGITKDPRTTAEHKHQLIRGGSELLERLLGKVPSSTLVVIDAVEWGDWGAGGRSVEELRS